MNKNQLPKTKFIETYLSRIWILNNRFVIKETKKDLKWERGGRIVASPEERLSNNILAHKKMPEFFVEVKKINKNSYIRNYLPNRTLEKNPQKLEDVIRHLKKFYLTSIKKYKLNKQINNIPFYGKLWKFAFSKFSNLIENKKDYKVFPVYILGDAKPENILIGQKYLSFDADGFSVGDISSDLELIAESYQFYGNLFKFKETLKLAKKNFNDIDNKIVEKILLGLIAIRKMEFDSYKEKNYGGERKRLLEESISFFKKYIKSNKI